MKRHKRLEVAVKELANKAIGRDDFYMLSKAAVRERDYFTKKPSELLLKLLSKELRCDTYIVFDNYIGFCNKKNRKD